MRRLLLPTVVFALLSGVLSAQPAGIRTPQPRLIVGIVVDQMRYDYLYRYRAKYGADGFNRLLEQGFSCENTHYNYMPTYTGPGHASIYTGTTPSVHGVIGNEWYDRAKGANIYVTADSSYATVGSTSSAGQQSPGVLLTTTITDELRLSNNYRSKVVGICLKDRGSILPAGHIPDACYWFDDATGNWITSTYYTDTTGLPGWVDTFNRQGLAQRYLQKDWTPLLPINQYTESFDNWRKYEKRFPGDTTGTFPYPLASMSAGRGFGLLRSTPFGTTFTLDFARAAIERMELGKDEFPDFLCLSLSSPDYVGHQFGVHAEETEDIYLRLDADLANLLSYLDQRLGKDNYLLFLTADHGAAETPVHLRSQKMAAGALNEAQLTITLNTILGSTLNQSAAYVSAVVNQQVYLNQAGIKEAGATPEAVSNIITNYLRKLPGVYGAFTREELFQLPDDYPFVGLIRRGIHPRRSGDIIFHLDPAWMPEAFFASGGTTHGSPYPYDTHVPLLWFGWKVPAGHSFAPVDITDITPTLAAMLRIMEPNGTTGKVIEAVVR